MKATRENIVIYSGRVFRLEFDWENPDESPIDTTSMTAQAQVRRHAETVDPPMLELTVDLNDAGAFVVSATATETADLPAPSEAVWDLVVINDGEPDTFMYGDVEIRQGVTR